MTEEVLSTDDLARISLIKNELTSVLNFIMDMSDLKIYKTSCEGIGLVQ